MAKNPYRAQLRAAGLQYRPILGEASAKTVKGQKIGYLTGICYLVPDDELCPMAKLAGCMAGCLRTAVVFDKRENIPESFRGWPVVDGDDTDVRHIEPARVVVALYAKGRARSDMSGFVQRKGRDF